METLDFILNGAETKRFHTWPVLREQRVDAHSWGVAMLYALMAQAADPAHGQGLTVPGLMAALTHDLAEHKLGDLPAPVKRELGETKLPGMDNVLPFRQAWGELENRLLAAQALDWEPLLAPMEHRWLKLADAMDGCLYCVRERMLGNRLIVTVFNNFRTYIDDVLGGQDSQPMEAEIICYIDDMWEQANGAQD